MELLFLVLAIAVIFIFFFRKDIKEKVNPDKTKNYTIDDKYNAAKREREKEIDQLLTKWEKTELQI